MIYGIGNDIVSIKRVADVYKEHEQFADKVLSKKELAIFETKNNDIKYLAKRWAGKEAIYKAIGSGFAGNCKFPDISILNDSEGKPYVEINGATKEYLSKKLGDYKIHISLSDDEYAIGMCVIQADLGNI
jgi:holo-[acyl-carrier protein] synthase